MAPPPPPPPPAASLRRPAPSTASTTVTTTTATRSRAPGPGPGQVDGRLVLRGIPFDGTVNVENAEGEAEELEDGTVARGGLRAAGTNGNTRQRRRIRWAEDVVNNEGMGRKSSKGMLYHLLHINVVVFIRCVLCIPFRCGFR